jgi:hypothetical protein
MCHTMQMRGRTKEIMVSVLVHCPPHLVRNNVRRRIDQRADQGGARARGVLYSGATEERDAAVGRNDLFWTLHARTIVLGKALLSATRRLHINGTGRLHLGCIGFDRHGSVARTEQGGYALHNESNYLDMNKGVTNKACTFVLCERCWDSLSHHLNMGNGGKCTMEPFCNHPSLQHHSTTPLSTC